MEEISQLRDEVIPPSIRPHDADDVSLVLNHDGLRFLDNVGGWKVDLQIGSPGEPEPKPSLRRLQSSASTASTGPALADMSSKALDGMVKYAKMERQVDEFLKKMQEFAAAKYNLHTPDLDEIFRGVNTKEAAQCAMEAAVSMNVKAMMECTMRFWSIAMDIMQNIAKSVGKVTTTTEKTVFASFDDLMN